MYYLLNELSELVDLPIDQVLTLLILLVISPMGGYISCRYLPSILRPFFNISMGICFLQIVVGTTQYHLAILTVITYILILLFNRIFKFTAELVFLVNFTYLTVLNVDRYMNCSDCWGVDITNIMMMAITKITAFAFCCQDGQLNLDY